MQTLQDEYSTILGSFAYLFSKRIWERVQILLAGAVLSPAEQTVTAALRAVGLSEEKHFQNYHRVLNRAIWSSREASRILLTRWDINLCQLSPYIGRGDLRSERRFESINVEDYSYI
jgi:hypothetical protein